MGIPTFMKNMQQDKPHIKNRTYDNVYIDCNYLLHYLIYNCKNDNDLNTKIHNYIKYLFETIKITSSIELIFDGKHPHHLQKINPKRLTQEKRNKNKKESDDYDKQRIAPKTEIITTFKTFITEAIKYQKMMNKFNFQININDDSIEDEADFKILHSINDNNFQKICIVSKDSDMVLIAYSMICKKNIKIDILSNLRPILFIDINELETDYNIDYILVILLLGNDYLPKLSNIDYATIMTNYIKYKKHKNPHIIIDGKVDFNNFLNFITYIILDKKVKYKFNSLDYKRFEKYYNNILWCLKKYKVIDNDNEYIEDTNNVINIYNFVFYNTII
jgi:hypothetical protein